MDVSARGEHDGMLQNWENKSRYKPNGNNPTIRCKENELCKQLKKKYGKVLDDYQLIEIVDTTENELDAHRQAYMKSHEVYAEAYSEQMREAFDKLFDGARSLTKSMREAYALYSKIPTVVPCPGLDAVPWQPGVLRPVGRFVRRKLGTAVVGVAKHVPGQRVAAATVKAVGGAIKGLRNRGEAETNPRRRQPTRQPTRQSSRIRAKQNNKKAVNR
jgi:hypothetical protein